MSREAAVQILLFCVISAGLILSGFSIFAFASPTHFVRWLWPIYALSRKTSMSEDSLNKFDTSVAYAFGGFALFFLALLCFLMGSWTATTALGLFNSPIDRLLYGP